MRAELATSTEDPIAFTSIVTKVEKMIKIIKAEGVRDGKLLFY